MHPGQVRDVVVLYLPAAMPGLSAAGAARRKAAQAGHGRIPQDAWRSKGRGPVISTPATPRPTPTRTRRAARRAGFWAFPVMAACRWDRVIRGGTSAPAMANSKTATYLVPFLAIALLAPLVIGVQTAPGGGDSQGMGPVAGTGVDRVKDGPSHTQIPLELDEKDLVRWFADSTDVEKRALAREKQDELSDALFPDGVAGEESIPVTSIGYDYVDNALEVTIDPPMFTDENIPQYVAKIRSIVGGDVDITISPAEYAAP